VTALRVTGLEVAYEQIVAVRNLSLAVEPGEALVLLGPNGAGKTSAVEAIAGLLPKRKGTVTFFGEDISTMNASTIARKGLALVPQWRELFKNFSVEETLLAAMTAAKGHGGERPLGSIYDLFPVLLERRLQLAGSLSGGEQQMLAIGRALMTNPKMILFDEPSAGLAAGIVRSLIHVICHIRDSGVPILLVEQNMEIARAVAKRCCILGAGSLAWEGSVQEALDKDEALRAYFGTGEGATQRY
jgi:branched-chain amino acid transport system ATP-binding protein